MRQAMLNARCPHEEWQIEHFLFTHHVKDLMDANRLSEDNKLNLTDYVCRIVGWGVMALTLMYEGENGLSNFHLLMGKNPTII